MFQFQTPCNYSVIFENVPNYVNVPKIYNDSSKPHVLLTSGVTILNITSNDI